MIMKLPNSFMALCILMSIACLSNAPIHKDRIETPKEYRFVFKSKETITFKTPNDSLSQSYNDAIVSGKKQVIEAELTFATGEKLFFKGDGTQWLDIYIAHKKGMVQVPPKTCAKLSIIHFQTVGLLWSDSKKTALESSYFYLKFDIGTKQFFNVYPELHLGFSEKKLSWAEVWTAVADNARQGSDF
jgi:hypothetical protein